MVAINKIYHEKEIFMKKNDDCFQHRRHNKNLLMVHLIFVTKYRKKLLYGDLKEDIKQWIFDTSVKNRWYVKRMETDRDHIHILLQYNPADFCQEDRGKIKTVQYVLCMEKI